MKDLCSGDGERETRLAEGRTVKELAKKAAAASGGAAEPATSRSTAVAEMVEIPEPPFYGVRVKKDFDLREVFSYINETALFKNQWQLKTASQADYARLVEEKYRPVLRELEDEVIRQGWFQPQAVYGWFPCQSAGNDVVIYDPAGPSRAGAPAPHDARGSGVHGFSPANNGLSEGHGFSRADGDRNIPGALAPEGNPPEIQRFTFPRQKEGRKLCISDFFAPRDSGRLDVIGFSVVTIGERASHETARLFESGEYTKYLYLHGLSVESAEALAELLHKQMRAELGIGGDDAPRISDLFHQKYRGSRYSFGYPACPNLEDQTKIFALLHPEETIGVRLSTGFLLEPEQSTSAIVVHHPDAKYFVA